MQPNLEMDCLICIYLVIPPLWVFNLISQLLLVSLIYHTPMLMSPYYVDTTPFPAIYNWKTEHFWCIGMSLHLIPLKHTHIIPTPRTWIIANINMVWSVDSTKLRKLVGVFKKVPHLSFLDAMKLAKYSDKDISNPTFWRFFQRTLPGGLLNSLRAILAGDGPPSNLSEQHQK